MAPTQPPPSGSWDPSTKAAVTLGIILGLILLGLSVVALHTILKKQVTRWITNELAYDRCKRGNYYKCEQSHEHGAFSRRQLSSNSKTWSLPPSTPPPVSQSRLAPSRPLREPHYYPRQDALAPSYYPGRERANSPYQEENNAVDIPYRVSHRSTRVEHPEPRSLEGESESGFSWVAGDERTEYRPPYAGSTSASAEAESPHGTTSRAGRARS